MDGAAQLAERGDGSCAITGELTMETAPWLWEELRRGPLLLQARKVDLAAVTEADSAGLALLIAWRASCKQAGGALLVENVPPQLAALAQLTGAEAALL
jgi:phospholipid transport system transporter-binding protein